MSPNLFESLLFLKVNSKYWDVNLVAEAMKMASSEKVTNAMDENGGESTNENYVK